MGEDPFESEPLLVGSKRGTVQVSAEILRAAEGGGNQSHLFRLANVNHARGKVYLEGLERAELLVERAGTYELTPRGRRFLEHWEKVEACLRGEAPEPSGEPGPADGNRGNGRGDPGDDAHG